MPKIKYETADGKLFDNEVDATDHEYKFFGEEQVKLIKNRETFLSRYSGQRLLENHSLTESGVWEVRGEDPNCDMGGYHHQPYIGTYHGTLNQVIDKAVMSPNFWNWGAGGSIKKVDVKNI